MPPRWSRRIAAYSSTFDMRGMTSTFHQEHLDAALAKPCSGSIHIHPADAPGGRGRVLGF
ncbi:hypothetical protein [Streptomyces sp. NPDC058424]|uniref:hypothetical protein n=1 Tax=Streptomyces sp. NPDC058424 TaxID=3346491 RepID=UPI00366172A1